MSVSPWLDINSVTTTMINSNKLSIPIWIKDTEERSVKTLGLIDSGAGGKFIDQNYAKRTGFKTHKLEKPLQAYNVDGNENKWGTIKYYVNLNLEINGRKMTMELLVTGLGKERIILGFPWLQEKNPEINWKTGKFSWREPRKWRFLNLPPRKDKKHKIILQKPMIEEIPDDDERKNQTINYIDDDMDLLISYINGNMERNI